MEDFNDVFASMKPHIRKQFVDRGVTVKKEKLPARMSDDELKERFNLLDGSLTKHSELMEDLSAEVNSRVFELEQRINKETSDFSGGQDTRYMNLLKLVERQDTRINVINQDICTIFDKIEPLSATGSNEQDCINAIKKYDNGARAVDLKKVMGIKHNETMTRILNRLRKKGKIYQQGTAWCVRKLQK